MEDEIKCIHCKTEKSYNEEFDAHYCKKCNYWLEKICPIKICNFCSRRPKYPLSDDDGIHTFISIPTHCYTVMAGGIDAEKYTVFYDGEQVHDVQGVIRMSQSIDRNEWNKPVKKSINWRKEIGE